VVHPIMSSGSGPTRHRVGNLGSRQRWEDFTPYFLTLLCINNIDKLNYTFFSFMS